ncbi:hypothetical protein SAMN05880568_2219 [Microbacterium sp. RURRCA19A]|nr:hypothetical protein SAMN05880568_2219 [Microbacterium sp. RURRCA19A]
MRRRPHPERTRRTPAAPGAPAPNSPVYATGLFAWGQRPGEPASVEPTFVRWKFSAERDAVGPRWPW